MRMAPPELCVCVCVCVRERERERTLCVCVHGKRKRKRKRSTHLLLALSNVRGDGALHHISPVSEPQEDPARGRVQKEACVAVERGRTRLDLYTAGARGRERARAYVHAFTSCTPRQLLYVLNIFLDCQYNTSLTLLLICMCMHLHHVHIDNYCSHTCQKRPTTVSKETYYSVKRDLLQCQKRPTTVSKETYYSV